MPVISCASGYRFEDVDGRQFQDFHLNGGTFNLGHRNPDLIEALNLSLETIGVGNHHFVSCARADLAEKLVASVPGLRYVVFSTSGSEANDVAIKSARWTTRRRTIVSISAGYHGRSGLSGAAGDRDNARYFLSEMPGDFVTVPFDDLNALAEALAADDVAAVLLEPIPATFGFVLPSPGYFAETRRLCDLHGTLLVADEVQTGLGRTGTLWSIDTLQVKPDILVTAKGLSGGLYPIGATVLSQRSGGVARREWLGPCIDLWRRRHGLPSGVACARHLFERGEFIARHEDFRLSALRLARHRKSNRLP